MSLLFAATDQPGLSQYFVGWGTLSLINAGLAQAKGHSGIAWWLISLLLGPVATFLIVVFLQPPPVRPGPAGFRSQDYPEKPMADLARYDDLA